ncbi:ATP-binding protein [Maricaulis sp.]|uniref:ATP-binding protein n=1 Tax=Maricaulis sp. TaxID=1486257 RepID=UPI0025BD91EC|nr:ATP-binding protein [Maricaulis sp.]
MAELIGCKQSIILQSLFNSDLRLRGLVKVQDGLLHLLVGHIPTADGKVGGQMLVFSDFAPTDSTLDTHLISVIHQQLLEDAQRISKELKAKSRQAEAANEAKTQFLATVSHEIRTPLNGVLGMADFLAGTELAPEQREALSIVIDSGQGLLTILNDVLDYSKVEAGELELENRAFDLAALIKGASGLFHVKAVEKGLHYVSSPARGWFMGDETRLRQILSNLVFNAIKFTQFGGVELRVEFGEVRDDGMTPLVFEVEDSGIGMSEEVQARLFKPFQQGEVTTARKFGGTGLGLAICKNLVEKMGGEISVRSENGRGSVFRVELALQAAEAPALAGDDTSESGQQVSLASLRVLAAEDNATNRIVLGALLKPMGVEPAFAENGREAVEMFREESFDVILMDVMMPEMSGLEATRAIRQLESNSDAKPVPIHALTANLMREQVAQYLECGMDGALGKPINVEELRGTLEGVAHAKSDAQGTPDTHNRKAS